MVLHGPGKADPQGYPGSIPGAGVFKMKKSILIIILIVMALLIVFIIYETIKPETGTKEEKLAKCLTEKGSVLYINPGCPICKSQQELFGNAVEFLNIVDCIEDAEICYEKQITGVPRWWINNQIYRGKRSLEQLAELSGCGY